MGSTVSTSLKSTIRRDWLDIEPKVYAALISGTAVAALLTIARLLHYPIDPTVQAFLPELAGVAAGYVKASTHKGGLAEQGKASGLKDAVTVARAVAAADPAAAPAVDGAEQVLAALGFDPAGTTSAISPVATDPVASAPTDATAPAAA